MALRRTLAGASSAAVALAAFVGTAPTHAAERTVILVGSFQSETGCSADWQPECAATTLTRQGSTSTYSDVIYFPAGTYELKTVIDHSWAENYGQNGAKDGDNIPLNLPTAVSMRVTYDDTTHRTTLTPTKLAGGTDSADQTLARQSLRAAQTKERFYFVMADRFANGSTANDKGGLTGTRLQTGYDPTSKGFYHGGDLKGVAGKLDYIKGLGTTAIWLTPSFKNKPVQGKPGEESSGYHGYWVTDFTQIDPHLGTNADMKSLIAAAHAKGMKVYFDIITNHTADVIDYKEGTYAYKTKASAPYKDASGAAFDDRDYVNKPFPAMNAATSFPYTPYFHSAADATAKTPAWLNDPTMYHNRGDSTWAGESATYGDFIGLDDLFTERPEVEKGMEGIYKQWVDFGIDGFRIDTVKHVNIEFWQKFIPAIQAEAARVGRKDFFSFGEVYDSSPQYMSTFTTTGKLQATLDFGFQARGVDYVKGAKATSLADFYAQDDWYTDADSNAYQLPTFLGNHDMGRVGMFLRDSGFSGAELLKRTELADSLMYLTRGNPVTYYGDEQGFMGAGGDQSARQDMFATQTKEYADQAVIGGAAGSRARYDTTHPLYRHIATLAQVRAAHPALADGTQQVRYAAPGAGAFVTSRYDRATGHEYLVAANNATTAQTVDVPTWVRQGSLAPIYGTSTHPVILRGKARITVPPLSAVVWRSTATVAGGPVRGASGTRWVRSGGQPIAAPSVTMALAQGSTLNGRQEIAATATSAGPLDVTFYARPVGSSTWQLLGTDDNAPYRVYQDVSALPLGTPMEYRAIARDVQGRVAATSTWGMTGKAAVSTKADIGDSPATQPGAVSVPGSQDSELGCSADWMPDCDNAQLSLDANDKIWKLTAPIAAGGYAYKAAIDKAWTENYGQGGVENGSNIDLTTTKPTVSFYYDPATHWVTSDAEGPIVTVPGTFQTELGCSKDDDAACMRPWLQDKDGDKTYTWATTKIPAGTYTFTVAHGLSMSETYGDGGVAGGPRMTVTVPKDGATTTFVYDSVTHRTTVTSG